MTSSPQRRRSCSPAEACDTTTERSAALPRGRMRPAVSAFARLPAWMAHPASPEERLPVRRVVRQYVCTPFPINVDQGDLMARSPHPDVEIPDASVFDYLFGGLSEQELDGIALVDGTSGAET